MNPAILFLGLSAIGFASGLRALTPLAVVSWLAVWGWVPLGGSRLAFLGTAVGAIVVSCLAIAELISDKLPSTASRLTPAPLGARILIGAFAVTAVGISLGQSFILGIVCGAVTAVIGAFAGFHARRAIVRQLGVRDWIIAVVEDLVTIGLVLAALKLLF